MSETKENIMAMIDVAMGGHVAEKMIIGSSKVTSGCSGDLKGATQYAYTAVRKYGMFVDKSGYLSSDPEETSEKYNALVDKQVKEILEDSHKRVQALLKSKEKELRALSKNLFHYDYLSAEEMDKIIRGEKLDKEKVREWESKESYLIQF